MKLSEPINRLWHPIWFLALSLLLILIILPLVRQGMFLDGVFYAAIAKNLSIGYGTIWQPYYSQTEHTVFYDHPPLAIYFQSLFFKLLGQGFGVERFYSFLMALGQFSIISWYWLKQENTTLINLGLLLFIWLLIPLNYIYASNMLEGTLTLFTTIATFILLIQTRSRTTFLLQYVISAVAVLIAFLCNGPTALFTIAVPLIQGVSEEKPAIIAGLKRTLVFTLTLTAVFTVFYLLVHEALQNTNHYINQQLLASVIGDRNLKYTGLYHLHILYLYFRAYWLASTFAILCIIISTKIAKKSPINSIKQQLKRRNIQLFLLLSLISSLPVGISHRQAFSYIIQSAPFFTLAIMLLCIEPFKIIINHFNTKPTLFNRVYSLSYMTSIICLITILYLANGYNRNEAMIKDIIYLSYYCKNETIISTSESIYSQCITSAYFSRNSMLSITSQLGEHYYLALKNEAIPEHYHLIKLPLLYYKLAEKNEEQS